MPRQKAGPPTKQSLVMAGPAVLFCACVAPAGWARLSGAARLGNAAGHGRPTKRQHDERRPARPPAGASLTSLRGLRLVLLGRLLMVLADRITRVTASRPA